MCGICGVYEYARPEAVEPHVLRNMLEVIRHRGPDDEGLYLNGPIALGNRRLSIIDLVSGKQPIYNEDESVVVVFNGEIYNYRDLREQLSQRGHRFSTVSDTEVIVHLYEETGANCTRELRGMFAFALWDVHRRRLLMARDHLGVKPLYYAQVGGSLVFGSEIKAILQHPDVQVQPDLDALSNFISLKYVPAPQTMFAGIYALPPGHLLICDPGGIAIHPYWSLSFANNQNDQSEEAYAEQLESLLRESVRLQLVSDVPFGAFLSGGLDSSTVVALMSHYLLDPVKTFSVGFEGAGQEMSELPYARLVAQQYQTDHHEVLIGPQHLMSLAEKVIWHLDQPIADEAVLANYMVAELASHHVKMVLTGEGGDELFAGYARYSGERLSPLFSILPSPVKTMVLSASERLPGLRGPKLALRALCQSEEAARLVHWFTLFNADMKAQLLSEELKSQLNGACVNRVFAQQLTQTNAIDPLSRMLYVDTKLWLPDDLLARGDKTSMAASIEARVPLLDHKLVEFAASLPPHLKLKRMTRKYLLKKVSRAWLPEQIIARKKKGFPVPFSFWFRGEARPFVRDILSDTAVRRRGLFEPDYVDRLLNEHESGFADHGSHIWGLLSVELWYRLYIDSSPRRFA